MECEFPQGIEVLVKKASVDSDFAELLIERRAEAAVEIALELTAAETAMLAAVPEVQLKAIIARTTVPGEHRRAFLGKAAAAMLAALGMTGAATAAPLVSIGKGGTGGIGAGGIRVGPPPEPKGPVIQPKVIAVVAKQLGVNTQGISRDTQYVRHLRPSPKQVGAIRAALEKEFKIAVPPRVCAKFVTIGDTCDYVKVTAVIQPLVLDIIAEHFDTPKLKCEASIEKQIKEDGRKFSQLRTKLKETFAVYTPWDEFKKIKTAGEVVGWVGYGLRKRATPEGKLQTSLLAKKRPPSSRGIQPDRPKGKGSGGGKGGGGSFGIRPQ